MICSRGIYCSDGLSRQRNSELYLEVHHHLIVLTGYLRTMGLCSVWQAAYGDCLMVWNEMSHE